MSRYVIDLIFIHLIFRVSVRDRRKIKSCRKPPFNFMKDGQCNGKKIEIMCVSFEVVVYYVNAIEVVVLYVNAISNRNISLSLFACEF